MYYARKTQNSTRIFGLAAVLAINGLVFWMLVSGWGAAMYEELTETEVAIIDVPEVEEEPPPPPPPVDVELPPPPPMVDLPDFIPNVPPPNAIQDVPIVKDPPRPQEVRPPPPPLPPVKPVADLKRLQEMLAEDYPERARRSKEEAEVTVSMCVNVQGRASDVKLVKSSGKPHFDDATVKGMAKLRFAPAKDSAGKPTAWCDPPFVTTIVWRLPKD
jgi:periplasmic protein TonB